MNLYDNAKVTQIIPAQSITSAAATGTGVDCRNANDVAFVVNFGALAAGCEITAKVQDSADNSTFADIAGASVTVGATDDNKSFVLRLYAPNHARYLRVVATESGGGAGLVACDALLLESDVPVTQPQTGVDVDALA